eukprot:6888050-Alexandrium_andersonii.AAC.1
MRPEQRAEGSGRRGTLEPFPSPSRVSSQTALSRGSGQALRGPRSSSSPGVGGSSGKLEQRTSHST